jgi:peptidoglycan/LPS O-acetylase OafA/YrhL
MGLFVAGFVARWYCWQHFVVPLVPGGNYGLVWYEWVYYPTWGRLDGLLVGITIAALVTFRPALAGRVTRYGNRLVVLSLMVLVGAYYLCADEQSAVASLFGFPVVALGYGLMVFAAVSPDCFLYKIKSGVTSKVAELSYGTYLLHKGLIHVTQVELGKWGVGVDSNVMFGLCIVLSLAGAYVLNVVVERPFLRWRKRVVG